MGRRRDEGYRGVLFVFSVVFRLIAFQGALGDEVRIFCFPLSPFIFEDV